MEDTLLATRYILLAGRGMAEELCYSFAGMTKTEDIHTAKSVISHAK